MLVCCCLSPRHACIWLAMMNILTVAETIPIFARYSVDQMSGMRRKNLPNDDKRRVTSRTRRRTKSGEWEEEEDGDTDWVSLTWEDFVAGIARLSVDEEIHPVTVAMRMILPIYAMFPTTWIMIILVCRSIGFKYGKLFVWWYDKSASRADSRIGSCDE